MFHHNKSNGVSWLVVFLGNPGKQYENTRHNAGFLAAEALEKKLNVSINRLKFHALTCQTVIGEQGVLLMKPQTFMNLSGDAAGEAAKFYKIPPEHVLVISDEKALAPGSLRIRTGGSAGGHNGLKSIILRLGSDRFPRIRLGVGMPAHADYEMADWVLGTMRGKELEDLRSAAERAAEAVCVLIEDGPDRAMNRFNGKEKI